MTALSERIRTVLELDPAADSVEFGGRWYSWGQLASLVKELGARFDAVGAGPNTPVGLVLRNSPEMIGAMLGTLVRESCIVTINPHQGDVKLAGDIRELRVPVLVAHEQDWARPGFLDAAREAGCLGLKVDFNSAPPVQTVQGLERLGSGPHRPPAQGVAVEMLTSGTTGTPKRVRLDYASFEKTISAAGEHHRRKPAPSREEGARLSSGVSIINSTFVHMSGLFRTLLNVCQGRKTALMDKFRVEQWVELVKRHQPKAVGLVPAAVRMVLDADIDPADLKSIQVVTGGSARLEPEVQTAFEKKYGIPVLPSYGATEFSGGVAGWTLPLHREWAQKKLGSVGRPQPGRQLRVVDPETGSSVAAEVPGLLEIYEKERWVRTTDIVRLDADGFLWIIGRADDAIVRGGFKIMPSEVSNVLRSHPNVREASVIGLPDARLGQVPVAAVELLDRSKGTTEESLLAFARERLTAYQVPTRLLIVDESPRTPSMKVSQPGVRALFESPGAS